MSEFDRRHSRMLLPCPDSPNCVSSQSRNAAHFVEPLRYKGNLSHAREQVLSVLRSMSGAKVVESASTYVRAEFTSALFRFVDDVEFYFPGDAAVIHVRSASRVGYYDFGVNRRRVERIRSLLTAQNASSSRG